MALAASLPSVPAGKIRVAVTIGFTGIAHLVDTLTGKLIVIPNGLGFMPPHELLLLVSTIYGPTFHSPLTDLGPTQQVVQGTVKDTYSYAKLTGGTEIDLGTSGFTTALNTTLDADTSGDATDETCPSPVAPSTSLHWLPRLGYVAHASALAVDANQTMASPDPKLVAGRMEISTGTLGAQPFPGPDLFAFKPQHSGVPDVTQAIADRLNYTFFVDIDDVPVPTFTLYGRGYGATPAPLVTLNVDPLARTAYILVANVPPGDFFKPPNKPPTLDHYEYHYGIFSAAPADTPVPTRGKSCGGGLGGGVECGPDRPLP